MNDLNGRVLPDSSTGLPSVASELIANAELNRLRTRLSTLEDENKILKAENAELREKCMTRFERIQKASPEQMAETIAFIYDIGYTDGREDADDDHHWLEWLQEIGTI